MTTTTDPGVRRAAFAELILFNILQQADVSSVDPDTGMAVFQVQVDPNVLEELAAVGADREDDEDGFDQEEVCEDEGAVDEDAGAEDIPLGGLVAPGDDEDREPDDEPEDDGTGEEDDDPKEEEPDREPNCDDDLGAEDFGEAVNEDGIDCFR